jgi:hypothetical protein
MSEQEKKDVYIGYVGEKKEYDSGVVKYDISFKEHQLDELKKYLTSSGNVNIDFVIKTDGVAFMSTFNPRAPKNQQYTKNNQNDTVAAQPAGDLPF